MTLDQLIKLSHELNYVHFPNAIVVWRVHGKWTAEVARDLEGAALSSMGARADTPDAALDGLKATVLAKAKERAAQAERYAQRARDALAAITAEISQ